MGSCLTHSFSFDPGESLEVDGGDGCSDSNVLNAPVCAPKRLKWETMGHAFVSHYQTKYGLKKKASNYQGHSGSFHHLQENQNSFTLNNIY